MALQSSGQITLQDIQDEFGGSHPIEFSEYYGSGGAPGSGELELADFYGLANAYNIEYLSIAGGGGGGSSVNAGGGGAGGRLTASGLSITGGTVFTITVGGGGG